MVNTTPEIVEDACNFAWMEFMRWQPRRDENWRAWLVTTAKHEAWRLDGKERGHLDFSVDGREDLFWEPADPKDVVGIRDELRAALDALAAVPEHRRRVKALWVTGFSYEEIRAQLGLTYTRVNRLMTEANQAIQQERARSRPDREGTSPRALRLEELEAHPPRWLVAAIGRPPPGRAPVASKVAWRRAALAIDDYRCEHAPYLDDVPLGRRPADARAARSYDLAERAITRARAAREITHGRSIDR